MDIGIWEQSEVTDSEAPDYEESSIIEQSEQETLQEETEFIGSYDKESTVEKDEESVEENVEELEDNTWLNSESANGEEYELITTESEYYDMMLHSESVVNASRVKEVSESRAIEEQEDTKEYDKHYFKKTFVCELLILAATLVQVYNLLDRVYIAIEYGAWAYADSIAEEFLQPVISIGESAIQWISWLVSL